MPEPVAPPVIVAHVWLEETVHEQFDVVVTVIVPVAPVGAAVICDGVAENVQLAPGSVIVKERPAIVSVAVREDAPVLAAAVYPTVPDPVPLAPLVIVTHGSVVTDLTGRNIRMGEFVVLRRGPDGTHTVAGQLYVE